MSTDLIDEEPEALPDELRYYSTKTVAKMFEVSAETIRDWRAAGKFPHAIQVSRGQWRIPHTDIVELARSLHG